MDSAFTKTTAAANCAVAGALSRPCGWHRPAVTPRPAPTNAAASLSSLPAGTIISAYANVLLCIALGWRCSGECDAPITTCCQQAAKPAEAATAANPHAPAATHVTADAAFLVKSQQAAAASMV